MEKLIEEDDFLARYVTWALWLLAVIVVVATITGQVESFDGLYNWFSTHYVTGFWADFAPLSVDSFTVIGELAIFAGIARHWDWKSRILPWASAMLGICSSVAANVGDKVQHHSIPTDLTGAIFPLAGAFGIVIGLGVLKRVAKDNVNKKILTRQADLALQAEFIPVESPEEITADTVPELAVIEAAERIAENSASLLEKLDDAPTEVVSYNPDRELKGMDVLIPPKPPVDPELASRAHYSNNDGMLRGVSREEGRMRLTDLKPGRPIINPDGLDVQQTGLPAKI